MKLIKNTKTDKFHEIEIERTFLFWKWTVKYRMIDRNVFRYKEPNIYFQTSISEWADVKDLFSAFI